MSHTMPTHAWFGLNCIVTCTQTEKATLCILRQPEMLHLETRIYFTLSSVVLYEFPQYEFPQAVRLYVFPQPVPVLDLASMVHVLQYR